MQREFIGSLRCPYTGSPFALSASDAGASIDFGIATSEAGRFPIIAGILRLLSDELQEQLVELIEHGQNEAVLRAALEVPGLARWEAIVNRLWRSTARRWNLGPVANAMGPGKQWLYRLVARPDITFATFVAEAKAGSWAKWQEYRFSMPTFLPVHALSQLAKGCNTILDFGCGLGHSAFLMKRHAANARMVCADYSFTSMVLAKRFLVPDAQCICLDGNYALPFREHYFDCVFSTDALQYIKSKLGLAKECERVLAPNGTIVLAHLHNKSSTDTVCTGKALTARGYANLFEGMVWRVYPEDKIVADFVTDGILDLTQQWTCEDLDRLACGLSLVAARTESAFGLRPGILDADIDAMRHPNLNPAYHARRSNGAWAVDKSVGAPYAVESAINDISILPTAWRIELESLESSEILALRDADRDQLRELVRRFIVMDMPKSYVKGLRPNR